MAMYDGVGIHGLAVAGDVGSSRTMDLLGDQDDSMY